MGNTALVTFWSMGATMGYLLHCTIVFVKAAMAISGSAAVLDSFDLMVSGMRFYFLILLIPVPSETMSSQIWWKTIMVTCGWLDSTRESPNIIYEPDR